MESKGRKNVYRFLRKHVPLPNGFDPLSTDLPEIVAETIANLEKRALDAEGLFRQPGSATQTTLLKKLYDKRKPRDLDKQDIHTVASLLKLFFLELPEPILTFELYDCFLTALKITKVEDKREDDTDAVLSCVKSVLNLLPIGCYTVVKRLMSFLLKIHQHSDKNKMNSANLAIVFAPNLIRPKVQTTLATMMEENRQAQILIELMISNYETLFGEVRRKAVNTPQVNNEPSHEKKVAASPKEDPKSRAFIQSLRHASTRVATSLMGNKTNGQVSQEEVSKLADLLMQGNTKDINDFLAVHEAKADAEEIKENKEQEQVAQTVQRVIIQIPDVGTYDGEVQNNVPHGNGLMIYLNGDKFQGTWHEGRKHGRGCYTEATGNSYEGEYKEDKKHGVGSYYMSSGNIYMGEFKNGKANGHGVYYYAKGGIYNGDWKDDLFDGKGTYIGNHTKYEGEFQRGKRHGKGTFITLKGNIYTGEYVDGQMEGRGVYMFNNGDKYEGEFKQGRFEGRGVYIFADGAVQQGIFHKGQYVGPDTEQSTQNNQESLPNISTLLKEDEVIVVAGDEDSADT